MKNIYKKIIITSLALISLSLSAANPPTPFLPSDNIQDPNCLPSDSNCYVVVESEASSIIRNGNSFGTTTTIGTNDNHGFLFETNNVNRLTIGIDGNIGIGTTTSSNILNINGITQTIGLDIASSAVLSNGIKLLTLPYEFMDTDTGGIFGSNFLSGINAGSDLIPNDDTVDNLSTGGIEGSFNVMIGKDAGAGTVFLVNSNFLGINAGNNATNANNSNFFGSLSGVDATNANNSNFLGINAGNNATNANNSNFFGSLSGVDATNANNSNFLGSGAGYNATNASFSNFLGINAGYMPQTPTTPFS